MKTLLIGAATRKGMNFTIAGAAKPLAAVICALAIACASPALCDTLVVNGGWHTDNLCADGSCQALVVAPGSDTLGVSSPAGGFNVPPAAIPLSSPSGGFNVPPAAIPLSSPSGGFDAVDAVNVAAAVPEPSTWAMMLLGFLGLGFAFRQSRRRVSFV